MKKIVVLGLSVMALCFFGAGASGVQAGCGDGKDCPMGKACTFEQATLSIEGMHCADCASAVKDAIQKSKGVKACEVSLDKKQATLCYEKGKLKMSKVIKSIEK